MAAQTQITHDPSDPFLARLALARAESAANTWRTVPAPVLVELFRYLSIEHRIPLPPSLSGKRGWRRLTVTLGWFTPINPLSHRWRRAALWFEAPKSKLKLGRVGPDWQAAQRGTLQHDTFEGQGAAAFIDGDHIVVRVSCREDAPGLDEPVPYAIAATLEVAESLEIDIYAEVRTLIRSRQRVAL